MNKGFTLIELLVVVLIIGILAAIALPQYTKAVERSRTAEAVQYLGDWATAQQIYFMQHDTFAADRGTLNNGDITMPALPATNFTEGTWSAGETGATVTLTRNGGAYGQTGTAGTLTLGVDELGNISKVCGVNSEFCELVVAAGYTNSAS